MIPNPLSRRLVIAAVLFAIGGPGGCRATVSVQSTERDVEAVRAVADAYVNGWLQDDADGVMATLSPDAVLLPQGRAPIQGEDAIRAFWWPPAGPATRVTRCVSSIDDLQVDGDLAYVRGVADLTFTWEQDGETVEQTSKSAYLMTLRRDDSGAWRITNRMWGRFPS